MIFDGDDKFNVILIVILFSITILVSIYVSHTRQSVHSFTEDIDLYSFDLEQLNLTDVEDEDCTYCYDHDIEKIIKAKFEEAGLGDIFQQYDEIETLTIPSFVDFEIEDECTPLFPFVESIKYSKMYKYTMNDEIFYVNEKFMGKMNAFYMVQETSNIEFNRDSYVVTLENYYTEEGECVYSEYKTTHGEGVIDCYGNYESFLCEEFIEKLDFIGEEDYFVYEGNYKALVYENNNTTIKFGKDVPVLFYFEQKDEFNQFLRIELLNIKRRIE